MRFLTSFLFFTLYFCSSKGKSTVKIEKAVVVESNKNYFAAADLFVQLYEDGTYDVNGDFELIQDVPNTTTVIGKIHSYVEYKYELVADTQGKNICQFLKDEFHDWLTDEYLAQQKMVTGCPIKKGVYWFKKFTPRDIPYPVANLWNKSLSELLFYYEEELLLHVKWYATLVKE